MRRRIRAATAWSWVITMIVVPCGVELLQQRQDGRAGGGVEVAGGLVGQHHRRRPAIARAIATRCRCPPDSWVGRARGPVPEPDPVQRVQRQPPPLARRTPAYSSPSATLPSTLWCSARKNCWNTNPIRDARSAASSRSVIRATSRPVTRTVPAGRLVQGAHQVQQRGLARSRRAHDGGQLPGRHRQANPVQRPHRRRPGIQLGHLVQLQDRDRRRSRPRPGGRPGRLRAAGHVAGTTTRSPGVSAPVTCTSPSASSKIPVVTGT